MPDTSSPFYPYECICDCNGMLGADETGKKLQDYLLDLPLPGYTPPDNNEYPRCRLMKRLYYDGARPLEKPLPTPEEKLSLVYDPERPADPPGDRGYRFFNISYPQQAQLSGQTIIRMYYGRTLAVTSLRAEQAFVFDILSSVAHDTNTRSTALSRTYSIAMDILRALNGVNISGVGGFYFDHRVHNDCECRPINDDGMNVGYRLVLAYTVMGARQGAEDGNTF
ncbi:MAG: hypothetical protein RR235_04965 [Oscillospiraceae bacterium]